MALRLAFLDLVQRFSFEIRGISTGHSDHGPGTGAQCPFIPNLRNVAKRQCLESSRV